MVRGSFLIFVTSQKIRDIVNSICSQFFIETTKVSEFQNSIKVQFVGDNFSEFEDVLKGFELKYEFEEFLTEEIENNYDYYLSM